jgi:hypothetical protein
MAALYPLSHRGTPALDQRLIGCAVRVCTNRRDLARLSPLGGPFFGLGDFSPSFTRIRRITALGVPLSTHFGRYQPIANAGFIRSIARMPPANRELSLSGSVVLQLIKRRLN